MTTRRSWIWAAATVAAVVTAACSSSSNNVSPTQACSDLATAICNKLQSCSSIEVQLAYGSVSECITRAQITCPGDITASGSGATTANIEACAQAYTSASCSDLESNTTPSACEIPGTLAAGTVCGTDQQCVGPNGYCKIAAGSTCGACATKAAAGGTCTSSNDCQGGLVCGGTSCVSPGAAGAACSATHPCADPLVCSNTTCSSPAEAGQACQSTADGQTCDTIMGVICNPTTLVCAQIQTASAGSPCGLISGGYTLCSGGSTCNVDASGEMGTCGAVAADGAACGGTSAATCLAPSICVNNTCTTPNPSSCH
jgi:hypothetical protein